MESFAQRLKRAMELAGFKAQSEFADKARVDRGHFNRLIHGERGARKSDDTVRKLAEASGVTVDWLATGRGPMIEPAATPAIEAVPVATRAKIRARVRQRGLPDEVVEVALSARQLAGNTTATLEEIDALLDLALGYDRGLSLVFGRILRETNSDDQLSEFAPTPSSPPKPKRK